MADHEKGPLNGTNIPVQKVPKGMYVIGVYNKMCVCSVCTSLKKLSF